MITSESKRDLKKKIAYRYNYGDNMEITNIVSPLSKSGTVFAVANA